jgi:L-cystine uptake protein TcyP (sodium:dicarboxylate symporter family)
MKSLLPGTTIVLLSIRISRGRKVGSIMRIGLIVMAVLMTEVAIVGVVLTVQFGIKAVRCRRRLRERSELRKQQEYHQGYKAWEDKRDYGWHPDWRPEKKGRKD